MTEQANYVYSKLPALPKTESTFEVPIETLQKYTGEFTNSRGKIIKLVLKDNKMLKLIFIDKPDMELIPISKNKFSVKFMDGFTIELILDEKDEATELLITSPSGHDRATKRK
jgi:hypothetical protein